MPLEPEGRSVSPEAPQERRATAAVWYVYFLRLGNGDIYVGSAGDLQSRIGAHQASNSFFPPAADLWIPTRAAPKP